MNLAVFFVFCFCFWMNTRQKGNVKIHPKRGYTRSHLLEENLLKILKQSEDGVHSSFANPF